MNLATQNSMRLIPKAVKWSTCSQTFLSLIQPLEQGVMRTFKAHYTQYSMKRIVNAMEEDHKRKNILIIRKGLKTPLLIRKKLWNPQSLKQFLQEKIVSRCYAWLQVLQQSQSGKPRKRLWMWQKKNSDADKCFWISTRQGRQWRSSTRKQTNIRQSSKWFQLFKSALDLFYDTDLSVIWALKIKHVVQKKGYHIETFSGKWKSKYPRNYHVFPQVISCACLYCLSSASVTWGSKTNPSSSFSSAYSKWRRMKTFIRWSIPT